MAKFKAKLNAYLAKSDRHFDKGQEYELDQRRKLIESMACLNDGDW